MKGRDKAIGNSAMSKDIHYFTHLSNGFEVLAFGPHATAENIPKCVPSHELVCIRKVGRNVVRIIAYKACQKVKVKG